MNIPDQFMAPSNNGNIFIGNISDNVSRKDFSGLEDAGKALQNINQLGTEDVERRNREAKEAQKRFDQQQAIRTFSDFQLADQQRQQQFLNNFKGDPSTFAQANMEDMQKFYNNFQTEPITQGAQDHLNGMWAEYQVRQQAQSLAYQAAAKGNQVKENVEVGARNLINDTRVNPTTNYWPNQKKIDDLVNSMQGLIPDDELKSYHQQLSDQNSLAMIRGKADIDPRVTLKQMQNGVYDKFLSPNAFDDAYQGLLNTVKAEDKQLYEQQRAYISGQMASHFQSIMDSNTPVLTRQQVAAVGDPDLLKQYDFETKVAQQGFKILKGSEGQPIEQRLKLLDSLRPKPGSPDYKDQADAYNMLQQSIYQQEKAYEDDPVQYSMQNGSVAKAFNTNPQEGIRASLSYQLGKGTPTYRLAVATKEEIQDFSDKINSLLQNGQFNEAKDLMLQAQDHYNVAVLSKDGRTGADIFRDQLSNSANTKLPDEFLFAMRFAKDSHGGDIFSAYKTKLEDFKTLLGEDKLKRLDKQVNSSYDPYAQVLLSNPQFSGTTQLAVEKNLMTKYAAFLMTKGLNETDAAKRAFKVMYPYEIINEHNRKLIIPDNINGQPINSSGILAHTLHQLGPLSIYTHLSNGVTKEGAAEAHLATLSVKGTDGQPVQLNWQAAQAFEEAQAGMMGLRKMGIKVNSGYRTTAEQKKLYEKYQDHGGPTAAKPGHSMHELGLGLDVQNYNEARPFLEANGWAYRPAPHDPWHFEYVGSTYRGIPNLPRQLSTDEARRTYATKLANGSGVLITNPDLRGVTLYSRNEDGSLTPVYNGYRKPYSKTYMEMKEPGMWSQDENLPPVKTKTFGRINDPKSSFKDNMIGK